MLTDKNEQDYLKIQTLTQKEIIYIAKGIISGTMVAIPELDKVLRLPAFFLVTVAFNFLCNQIKKTYKSKTLRQLSRTTGTLVPICKLLPVGTEESPRSLPMLYRFIREKDFIRIIDIIEKRG